ncbi:metal-sulfur cluster assembly factor [Segetibacter koreensis]|uniref:metal-sulfur cluster assembly factor n=1 Tax=Segetibacter koreensis TaxID=398037 RepID=UPI00037285E6|nr:metal-sulfur cluster assembly factor [Segetibacter koreensis]
MEVITNNNLKCTIALAGLYNVHDPEIGLNVVDLGLIYQIDFDEEAKEIYVSMTLTSQFCPMGESITNGVKQSASNAFQDYSVSVQLIFNPAWNADRISIEGQEFLNR